MNIDATACDRCGTYAELKPSWDRRLCANCLAKRHFAELEPSTARHLVGGSLKLAASLGTPAILLAASVGAISQAKSEAIGSMVGDNLWRTLAWDVVLSGWTTDLFDAVVILVCLAHIRCDPPDAWRKAGYVTLLLWPKLGAFNALAALASSVGMLLCLAPGFVICAVWVLALPILLVERRSIRASIREGMRRGGSNFGNILLACFVLMLVPIGLTMASSIWTSEDGPAHPAIPYMISALATVAGLPGTSLCAIVYAKLLATRVE